MFGPRQRHQDELRRVYNEHLDAVFAFFSYCVGNATAEDLAATTFERVVKYWTRYDAQRASERTWILAIARNALIDHYRRDRRNTSSLDEFPALAERFASHEHVLDPVLAVEGFSNWLVDLPERDRQILALRYAADLTGAEIAKLTELSEANVHQILSRALKKLRTRTDAGVT